MRIIKGEEFFNRNLAINVQMRNNQIPEYSFRLCVILQVILPENPPQNPVLLKKILFTFSNGYVEKKWAITLYDGWLVIMPSPKHNALCTLLEAVQTLSKVCIKDENTALKLQKSVILQWHALFSENWELFTYCITYTLQLWLIMDIWISSI